MTSFLALFGIVGIALYGLPFFYDFMVREFGWSRAQVTSGNALSKLLNQCGRGHWFAAPSEPEPYWLRIFDRIAD